mmetsp:Transcript_103653/g.297777  ORF Transcript_103653/g.297777 Transcript_103653/m.297777 type:complete len:715 (+) Transcript_103653:82-2226(+)
MATGAYGTWLNAPSAFAKRSAADPIVSESRRKEREFQWKGERTGYLRNLSLVAPLGLMVLCATVGTLAYSRVSLQAVSGAGGDGMGTLQSGEPISAHQKAASKPSTPPSMDEVSTSSALPEAGLMTWGAIKFQLTNPTYPSEIVGGGYPTLTVGLIVQPYVTTHLEAQLNSESDDVSDDESLSTCSWTIMQKTGDSDSSIYQYSDTPTILAGSTVSHMFTSPATYHVSSTCTTSLGNVHTTEEEVECIYIRRELRDLSDMDLDSFLDAFQIMTEVTSSDGKAIYGSNFHHLDHFVQMHLNAAALRSHDGIHDGMGVVTQHASVTSKFELSLQAVDPSVTVPYWDYTRDSTTIKQNYLGDASSVFKSDFWINTFGKTSDVDHHISTGRFANQLVGLANASDSSAVMSAYGFLRAPWNLNPSAYVTRYHKQCGAKTSDVYRWPTCMNHWSLTFKKKTWYDWIWDVSYTPHGPVHVWVGGMGGDCADMDLSSLIDEGYLTDDDEDTVKNFMFVALKNMWRAEMIEMPKSCSSDASSECTIKCKKEHEQFLKEWESQLVGVMGFSIDDWSNATIYELADDVLCDHAFWPGDHLEAASPVEASFWPIHPTLDRLLQYKMMVDDFAEDTWDIDRMTESKKKVYCEYSSTSDCEGHHSYDLTFSDVITRSDDGSYTMDYVSNMELRTALSPSTYAVSYIYNDFEWEHCNDLDLAVTFPSVV